MPRKSTTLTLNDPDCDPLLEDSNHELKRNKGIILNRRERALQTERCGRIRLGIFVILIFFLVYFCFAITSSWHQDDNFIVTMPADDDSFPGPKAVVSESYLKLINNTKLTTSNRQLNKNKNFTTITTTTTTTITTTNKKPTINVIKNNQTTKTTVIDVSINDVPQHENTKIKTRITTSTTNRNLPTTNVYSNQTVPHGFLVFGDGCRIPDLNPLASDVMKLFHKEHYKGCFKRPPLTKILHNFTTNVVNLVIDNDEKKHYDAALSCCYQEIERSGEGKKADSQYNLTQCTVFKNSIELPPSTEFILVECSIDKLKIKYTNVHAIVRDRPEIRSKLDESKTQFDTRPLSVLMIGIDSISRLNLIRAMPMTAQHLYDNGWFELRGYNKIDDNTFPNLMAILTGYNNSLAYSICNPKEVGKLDKCPFMWNYYKDSGYVTAYAEDEANINTFNYNKFGFVNQPTDFYLRPAVLAAEKHLKIEYKSSLKFCLGYKHSADYIYDYALDFVSVYKDDPYFGLFWTNTFSHNDISDPSSMDQKVKNYLKEFEERGVLNNSMVVFFSDHGLRFGPVRKLVTGWLEERLPFMFIWLPPWFKEQHPEIVRSLKINRNRLTNPYDLHVTLKHVLELSNRSGGLPSATSCPQCQSIFEEMPFNRSCAETEIAQHWCTCTPYVPVNKNTQIVQNAVKYAIDYINNELNNNANGTKRICAELKLKTITFAGQADYLNVSKPHDDNLLVFETVPGNGIFESTVRYHIQENKYEITGSISRLNRYDTQSICIHVDYLKKYCYCLKKAKTSSKKN